MGDQSSSKLAGLSRFLGRFRGLFIPFGLFAVLAVGIHAGGDRVDDHLFVLFNCIDSVVDDVLTAAIRFVCGIYKYSPSTVEDLTYRAVDFIDVDFKDRAARGMALVLELLTDVLLAVPIFFNRGKDISVRALFTQTWHDPTVLRYVAPLATVFASLGGVFVIAREIQVSTHSTLTGIGLGSHFAGQVAGVLGLAALALVAWRLGAVTVLAGARWAELKARDDRAEAVRPSKRRARGLLAALVVLPVTFLALVEGTAVVATLRALLPV